jgi:tRNA A-37 threonylcarbamoyl transferase component Bud32
MLSEIGGVSIFLIVAVVMFCVFVVPVVGVAAIVYFIANRGKNKPPQPAPIAPMPVRPVAPLAAQSPPVYAKTQVMGRACPQCGAALPPDAPEGLCPGCLLQRGFATEAGPAPAASAFVPPPISELAALFPQLEIQECLGRGGMGAVYKARQPRLDRVVALKILAPEKQSDPQFAERFEREARVLARLSHPNIVSVFDFGEVRGRFYLIMEYVDGLTLRQVMQTGRISPAQALQLVPRICEALQYAHEQGIVHRDIKPENILLDKQGRVKIADFGIAKIAGVEAKGLSLTGARDVMGTPAYMAPEQVEKPQSVDHRADIYSLGVVFYEMLTGELPLGKFAPPSQKVQMDVRLDEVVLHALEKEPARRYQHASQVKTAVETIAGSPPPIAPVAGAAASVAVDASSITWPAVALMVAGAWIIASALLQFEIFSWLHLSDFLGSWTSAVRPSVVLFHIVPGGLAIFGGWQMQQRRSYAWAVAGGILAILACSVVGFIAGIWSLVVLRREDVKAAFGVGPAAAPAPATGRSGHFWRNFFLISSSMVLLLLVVTAAAAIWFVSGPMKNMMGWNLPKNPGGRPVLTVLPATPAAPSALPSAGYRQENGEYWTNFTRTFPLTPEGQFSVDNINGRTEIHGWSSNLVVVATAMHGANPESVQAIKVTMDADADHVAVHTRQPSAQFGWTSFWDWLQNGMSGDARVDYTVWVPAQAELHNVSSVNGSIAIDGVAGDITASTVNGGAKIKDASHNLKLETVNGSISAEMNTLGKGQSVSLNTVNGRLKLAIPENADARFSMNTVNGGISSEFSTLQPHKEFPLGSHLNAALGNGAAQVKADTVNGHVDIAKFVPPPATNAPGAK